MKIHHVLLLCFLSALCGGNTGLVSAKLNIYTVAEGGNGKIDCCLPLTGSMKFFCKDQCKEEGILIKTDGVTANNGRYSMKFKNGSSGQGILSVSITNLTKSDSGRYICGLGKSSAPDSNSDFVVRVSDELLDKNAGFILSSIEGETLRKPCFSNAYRSRFFFCKDECNKEEDVLIETDQRSSQSGRYGIEYINGSAYGLYVTIQQVTKSDTGRYKCGYGRALSPISSRRFSVIVIEAPTTSKPTSIQLTSTSAAEARTTSRPTLTLRPSTSVPSTSSATSQSLGSSTLGSSTPSPVFPETTNQPEAAALTTFKPTWPLRPSTSVQSTSSESPQSLEASTLGSSTLGSSTLGSSTLGSSTPSSVFSEATNQPAAAALTTFKPTWPLRPSTSVQSTSSETPQSFRSSTLGSSTPSPVFSEATNQPAAAALTTSNPNPTLRPLTSVPSTFSATTTPSLGSRSESITTPSDPNTINQFTAFSYVPHPDNSLLLVVGLPLGGVSVMGAFLLLLHMWKKKKNMAETLT
ncbi:mucin-5AC-like isoform X2 [Anabas testudineus]|uniref:mucin-5AC-like isoform X2 n=1 Tax=Anabas testudineus TaxID=64144 RepID=UPI000E45E304|nr:mucin-5AC-like isoform X2 [Anabas testudineus]